MALAGGLGGGGQEEVTSQRPVTGFRNNAQNNGPTQTYIPGVGYVPLTNQYDDPNNNNQRLAGGRNVKKAQNAARPQNSKCLRSTL